MNLSTIEKKSALRMLGAKEEDMDSLLEYTNNAFSQRHDSGYNGILHRWSSLFSAAREHGAAYAINKHLVSGDKIITFDEPDTVEVELCESIAGMIPVITAGSVSDFESLVIGTVYRGKPYPHIKNQGASFAYGERNRFIILSRKPYSNMSAETMGLDESLWQEKSMAIRKAHECAHYYTKRYYGTSRNNLHDELIADFCGIWAAFSRYDANLFMQFLDQGRISIYIEKLSNSGGAVVKELAMRVAEWVESWSISNDFKNLNETQRIDFLCRKELLGYAALPVC